MSPDAGNPPYEIPSFEARHDLFSSLLSGLLSILDNDSPSSPPISDQSSQLT